MKRILFLLLTSSITYATDIGSDTAVTRINTQQILVTGDRVAGFTALQGGFDIYGPTTTATFDSFFGVSGRVDFNSGSLVLNRDLIFQDVSTFNTLGNILGNGHVVDLAASMTLLPVVCPNSTLCNTLPINLLSTTGDLETGDFSYDNRFFAVGLGEDNTANTSLRIFSFSNSAGLTLLQSQILPGDTTGNCAEVTTVYWRPNTSLFQIAVTRGNKGSNNNILIYQYNTVTNALTLVSGVTLASGVSGLGCAWNPNGTYLAVTQGNVLNTGNDSSTSDSQARLKLYSVSAAGILTETTQSASNPNLLLIGKTIEPYAIKWDPTGNFIGIGTGTGTGSGTGANGNELFIFRFTENVGTPASSTLALSASANFAQNCRMLDFHPTFTDLIAVGIQQSGSIQNLFIYQFNPTAGTLTNQTVGGTASKTLSTHVRAVRWSPDGTCLGIGLTPGNDIDVRIYQFIKNGSTLTLNNGSFISDFQTSEVETFAWKRDGTAIVVGNDANLIGGYLTNAGFPTCNTFSNVDIYLNSNLVIPSCCITFTGQSLIDGHGHCLTILPTATVIVGSGASLALRNLTLVGNNIIMTDSTSTLTFKNVEWDLENNYAFTTGHFDIFSNLTLSGNGLTFAYQSNVVSTIQHESRLILDHGVTFSYAPAVSNNALLSMIDGTSQLILNGALLFSTNIGMQLTKGQVVVDSNSFLSCDGIAGNQAILFGDGITTANNVTIQWLPAATLEILKGRIVYNNV